MRARVLVLPAAALLVVGLLLRHSLAVPETTAPSATVAHSDTPQMLHPGHATAPTPRPELPPDDVASGDDDSDVPPELPPECPEGCPSGLDNGEQYERLPAVSPNTIHGHLTDTRGMPVSGAVVTAVETGTRVSTVHSAVSGDSGYYALPDLPRGSYMVIYVFEGQSQHYDFEIDGKQEIVAEPVLATAEMLEHDPEDNEDQTVSEKPNIDYEYEL